MRVDNEFWMWTCTMGLYETYYFKTGDSYWLLYQISCEVDNEKRV